MKGVRRVKNYVILTGDDFLKFYRQALRNLRQPDRKRIKDTATVRKAVTAIFKAIAEGIVENIGGVFLKRLGYFGVWRSGGKLINTRNYRNVELNEHTDGYQYVLDYFPDTSRNRLVQSLCMDGTFNINIKKGVSKNLRRGMKYKNYYFLIKESNKRRVKL